MSNEASSPSRLTQVIQPGGESLRGPGEETGFWRFDASAGIVPARIFLDAGPGHPLMNALSPEPNHPSEKRRTDDVVPASDPFVDTVSLRSEQRVSRTRPVPDSIGRYRVIRPLGGGSFGEVYLGHDDLLDRPVAIKVPSASRLAGDHELERFLNEARAAARIRHPSVVAVYDFGRDDAGRGFVVEEFVEGVPLDQWSRTEEPDFATTARVIADVADALQIVHDHGLVHRDIKPANILMDHSGQPHIADFGAALLLTHPEERTQLSGSPAYMSPEQTTGEGQSLDRRSDIWSLGVVLHELLTGRPPFCGASLEEVFNAIRSGSFDAPRQVRADVPPVLERICLTCLSLLPEDRYRSSLALAVALRQYCEDPESEGPVFDQSETLLLHGVRGGPHRRRREQWKLIVAGLCVIGFAATGLVTLVLRKPPRNSDEPVSHVLGREDGRGSAERKPDENRHRLSSASPIDGVPQNSSTHRLRSGPGLREVRAVNKSASDSGGKSNAGGTE